MKQKFFWSAWTFSCAFVLLAAFALLAACASTSKVVEGDNDFSRELNAAKQAARQSLLKDSLNYQSLGDLHYAAGWGSKALVEYILQRDGAIDVRDKAKRTPLFLAAGFNKAEVVEFLLSKGANLEAQNESGTRPIHMAAGFNPRLATLKAIVDAGSDIQQANKMGSTPLHWAAGSAALEQSKLLIDAGADAKAKDNKGKRPVDIVNSVVLKNKTTEERKAELAYLRSL